MTKRLREPLILIGSTPRTVEPLEQIVLHPLLPVVAETRHIENGHIIRIADYQRQAILWNSSALREVNRPSFSPDGNHLCICASQVLQQPLSEVFILRDPWDSQWIPIRNDDLCHVLHVTWLDSQTMLFAGITQKADFAIGVASLSDQVLRILPADSKQTASESVRRWLDAAYCAPSGLVALITGHGRRVELYRLQAERNGVALETTFDTPHHGNMSNIAISSDDSMIGCWSEDGGDRWLGLLNCYGELQETLSLTVDEIVFQDSTLLLRGREHDSYRDEVRVYQLQNGKLSPWCAWSVYEYGSGSDLIVRDVKTFVALRQDDHTAVHELIDADILRLDSEQPESRCEAAHSLGERRFRLAVPSLTTLLWDNEQSVQQAAVQALTQIGDPAALPQIIRAFGYASDNELDDVLKTALRRFSAARLIPAIWDCLRRSGVAYRRGAARVLEHMPTIEALEQLSEAMHDGDREVRLRVASALRPRRNLAAVVPLMAYLNDPDKEVKDAVVQALSVTLKANGLPSPHILADLPLSFDIGGFCQSVLEMGRMADYDTFSEHAVGKFLSSLASACVESKQSLPTILNAIEALTVLVDPTTSETSRAIGLTMALICAETMHRKRMWREAAVVYRYAAALAEKIAASQVEWRAWYAVGECREALGHDANALIAYQTAMDLIDRQWFILLEEDKLRGFFRDKATLYDRAMLCYLRLGHAAMAFECEEKAKTRYLGDLIARRQMRSQTALAQELNEFWRDVGRLHAVRVPIADGASEPGLRQQIIAFEADADRPSDGTIVPEQFAALQSAHQRGETAHNGDSLAGIRNVWRLVTYAATTDHDTLREYLEEIYQALLPVYLAAQTRSLPVPADERRQYLDEFEEAAAALKRLGGNDNMPVWIFADYGRSWLDYVSGSVVSDEGTLELNAMMEALNSVLHNEPVFGLTVESDEEGWLGPHFVAVTVDRQSTTRPQGTLIIETSLERFAQTRWQYVTQISRGEICRYRDMVNSLSQQPHMAHLQFAVTDSGTVVYLICVADEQSEQSTQTPNLDVGRHLQIFMIPSVTLPTLRQRLLEGEDSWFRCYHDRPGDFEAWLDAMDRVLEWLYLELITPIDGHLKASGIHRLRIVPHRGLHLIPFAALFSKDSDGHRHYLIDDYDITYAPSSTLHQICQQRAGKRSATRKLTAIGNPTGDLAFSAQEVERAERYFPSTRRHTWYGQEAMRSRLTDSPPHAYLHFAGHGKYNWDDPLSSHLLFAQGEVLSLADLFGEQVPLPQTILAVLSACETGVTDPQDLADEYYGIASGFVFAGTPAVLSTLWTVDDISTALLIDRFYSYHLGKGLPPSQALRQAQHWLRTDVDLEYVSGQIDAVLSRLEAHREQTPRFSEAAIDLDRHIRRLLARRQALLDGERSNPGGRPFAHPYYWAAFTVWGADVPTSSQEKPKT